MWLESCRWNPQFDFLLVTDNHVESLPDNVKLLRTDLISLKNRVSVKLRSDIVLNSPYKLCDYKPSYGLMFEDELKGYDFWGHCDMDLIWGNLSKFLNKNLFDSYDKIYRLGHLSLYRNNYKCNTAFLLPHPNGKDFKSVAATDRPCIFDELNGIGKILEANNFKVYNKEEAADITFKRYRMTLAADNNYNHQIFMIRNGGCYRIAFDGGRLIEDEFPYIHMQKRRYENILDPAVRSYIVSIDRFIPFDSSAITESIIDRWNRYKGRFYEKCEYHIKNIRFRFSMWNVKRKLTNSNKHS